MEELQPEYNTNQLGTSNFNSAPSLIFPGQIYQSHNISAIRMLFIQTITRKILILTLSRAAAAVATAAAACHAFVAPLSTAVGPGTFGTEHRAYSSLVPPLTMVAAPERISTMEAFNPMVGPNAPLRRNNQDEVIRGPRGARGITCQKRCSG